MRQAGKPMGLRLGLLLCALALSLRLLLPWPAVERVLFGQADNRAAQAFSALRGALEQSPSVGRAVQVFYMELANADGT